MNDLWRLGKHRLICGDCTKPAVIKQLMGKNKAVLCHSDPPYGMGKKMKNDNLYKNKLDDFQMKWWKNCRPYLENNASVYIWGKPENLWSLWYLGGLKDSERLTYRNEIVWEQEGTSWGRSGMENLRMFASATERCLFFMLGEQGFNNNADNYWEGWESIRQYLLQERLKLGWDIPTMKTVVGHSDLNRDHWTGKSQWSFPTKKVYMALQKASKGLAFKKEYEELKKEYEELKKEYEELKKEFYSTRAYFNNTHDNMTDVWRFPRVKGKDRWGHPTPKPVDMIERIIKSSSKENDIIIDPFLGSGTTIMAAQNTNRICYASEIEPKYCSIILQRFKETYGIEPTQL